MTTIETLVCDTILQNPQTIVVKDRIYKVAPPTVATIIEASKCISQLPAMHIDEQGNVAVQVLSVAKDCEVFGDIAATLMLGRKNLVTTRRYLFGLIKHERDNRRRLSGALLDSLTAEELQSLILELLKMLRVDFFLGITIFLQEINQLKKTKEPGATVSGQELEALQENII